MRYITVEMVREKLEPSSASIFCKSVGDKGVACTYDELIKFHIKIQWPANWLHNFIEDKISYDEFTGEGFYEQMIEIFLEHYCKTSLVDKIVKACK
jgi:hypothetical protein